MQVGINPGCVQRSSSTTEISLGGADQRTELHPDFFRVQSDKSITFIQAAEKPDCLVVERRVVFLQTPKPGGTFLFVNPLDRVTPFRFAVC
jgi:hypothetical protein